MVLHRPVEPAPVFSKFEFPAHASGADETLVSVGLRSNRRRHNVRCTQWRHNTGSSTHLVKALKASAVEAAAPVYAALRTRILSRSKLERPYMERLINLRRCTFPSTAPLLQPCSRAAFTAAASRLRGFAKEARGLFRAAWSHGSHAARSRLRTIRKNSRATDAAVAIPGERRNNSSRTGKFGS